MTFTSIFINKKNLFFVIYIFFFTFSAFTQCPTIVPSGTANCKLSAGSVELTASGGSGLYSWYDAGGNYLGSGEVFNTPHIGSTTDFFVASADTVIALDFDGADDYVALGNPAQLQITGDMTIEMWLKPDNFSSRKNPYAKAYGGEGTITQEPNGTLNYYYGTNGGNAWPYQGINCGLNLIVNEWNHIAIVRDLTNLTLYWYINGELTNQTTASYATATAGGLSAIIGDGYTSNYDGQIDEVRIWNTARTAVQIKENKDKGLVGNEVGLAAYYAFNEKTGITTATDLTANANHGTLTNMDAATDWVDTEYVFHNTNCESVKTTVTATIGGGSGVDLGNDALFDCGINSIDLDAGAGYANYEWSTGATSQIFSAKDQDHYWVKVDNGAGCSDGDTISITNASGALNTLDFDGTDDFVTLGNPAQLQITGDMTIEMWLKPDNFSSRKNPYAKAYGGEGTITQETNGKLHFFYGTNGSNASPYQGFNSGVALKLNEWNHIALVRDLTNMQLYWYVNGVLTAQVAASYATATAGGNSVLIGDGYTTNYDGQIEEVRIWDVARTQSEVRNKMCSKLKGTETGLQAYYQFDEGAGEILTDLSVNKLHGKIKRNPIWTTSSAAIGDSSVYLYPISWAGESLTHTYCGEDNLTVENMTGSPDGVHIYYVNAAPKDNSGIDGLGANDRYFGVHKVNDATATYNATYNYTGNPFVSVHNESTLQLFKRDNNADLTWVNSSATLNLGTKTLEATAQGTEFALGSSAVALPIKLISFEAKVNKNKVDLKWITSAEINNDYFTVERSKDAIHWNDIIDVSGAGNSNQIIEYVDVDLVPLFGFSYYRLKQTDFNGEYTYSKIIPIKFEGNKIELGVHKVYPNPINSGEKLFIEFKDVFESEMFVILKDINGKELFSKIVINTEGSKLIEIPISSELQAGIYFIIASSENQVYSQKIIVR